MDPKPFYILKTPVHILNLKSAVEKIYSLAIQKQKAYVIFRDIHGLVRCQDDPEFLQTHTEATLVCPDGMPLVWMGRIRGHKEIGRVYGPDLMRDLMVKTQDGSATHFLFGGNEGIADMLKTKLESKYPGISINGTFCPPFREMTPVEMQNLKTQVTHLKPDFFWVGLSTPKQERFMNTCLYELDTHVMLGVGAAFDYLSDTIKEPPVWIQRSGLQWLYRIFCEPKRLFKRYATTIPRFLWLLIKDTFSKKQPVKD